MYQKDFLYNTTVAFSLISITIFLCTYCEFKKSIEQVNPFDILPCFVLKVNDCNAKMIDIWSMISDMYIAQI